MKHAMQRFQMAQLAAINAVRGVASRANSAKMFLFALLASLVLSEPALAFTAPATGSFAYDVYDIVFTKTLNGPIGWVTAGGLMIFGITQVMKQWVITLFCLIAATMVLKLGTIMASLGFVV